MITHFEDGSFQWNVNGTTHNGPTRHTFIVSHDKNNFVFVISRQVHCFNNNNTITPSIIQNGPRKVSNNKNIIINLHNVMYNFNEGCFNLIDCKEYELLLLANGYFLLFNANGHLTHSSAPEAWKYNTVPRWLSNHITPYYR